MLTGRRLHTDIQDESKDRASFQLCLVPSIPELTGQPNAAEGYQLRVSAEKGFSIAALTRAGLFYGVQSALQLLPPTPPTAHGASDSGISVPAVLVSHSSEPCCYGRVLSSANAAQQSLSNCLQSHHVRSQYAMLGRKHKCRRRA